MSRALTPITVDRIDPEAGKVVRRLLRHGHEAFLVGGCVRDLLLSRTPKDFDVATSATPTEIRQLFRNSRIIGRRFRLVHIFFGPKLIETATFRAAPRQPTSDGDPLIWQDNEFGTAKEDARRRDFTINGLFYDVGSGKVIDWVDGMADLRHGCVRTIGEPRQRMQEDPVRILRAAKFAARLGFTVDEATRAAMVEHAALLARCSVARVLEEIYKLLRGGSAAPAFRELQQLGALDVLFPELGALFDGAAERAMPALRAGRRRRPKRPKLEILEVDEDDLESLEALLGDAVERPDDDVSKDKRDGLDDEREDDEREDDEYEDEDEEREDDEYEDEDEEREDDEHDVDEHEDDEDEDDEHAEDEDEDEDDEYEDDEREDDEREDEDDEHEDDEHEDDEHDDDERDEREREWARREHEQAMALLERLDLTDDERRSVARQQLWSHLDALDALVQRLDTPPIPPLLLGALLSPLAGVALRPDRKMGATAEQVDALVRAVALRLQVSRRHRERLKQIIVAQRRLLQGRPRPALMQREYFPAAFQLLELRAAAEGEAVPDVGHWEELGRRRRRRRRKRPKGSSSAGEKGGQGDRHSAEATPATGAPSGSEAE